MTGVIERVTLTHLQIPLKEPFRISSGEVAIKDAILVTLATGDGEGVGESSPMAAGFGYSTDTPLEWIYRYARQARLVDGADEVHRMVLDRMLADEGDGFWRWEVADAADG